MDTLALTVYYNEQERWIHVITSSMEPNGTHKVIHSEIVSPPAGVVIRSMAEGWSSNVGNFPQRTYRVC